MLRGLDIRDMLIIDRLSLDFQPGLNVLTGETGAGKSILLDSLGFVLGWRGRADLVRQGAAQGEVTAIFDLPAGHAAFSVLEEAGFVPEGELILRRVNYADGRKQAYVNDRRVSGEVLRNLSQALVELHGQHDDRGLLNSRGHRALLDAFAAIDAAPMRRSWRVVAQAEAALEAAQTRLREARKEEEFLRHSVSELEALDPQPGEEAELDTQRRLMQAGSRIREDIAKALQALGPDGAEGSIGDASRWLDAVADKAEGALDAPLGALERAMTELGDAAQGVELCLEALSFDPRELEAVEERLFALRGLARKHDVLPDELAAFSETLQARLEAVEAGEAQIAALRMDLVEARETYDKRAGEISTKRGKAARALDKAMAAELGPLKMERAVFTTQISEDTPGPDGLDAV
ncbi:MAG: AAA family ATPase, partial [Litoreibacter sp.]|nr:AAA family ATPase [Litoreibacter sp.]